MREHQKTEVYFLLQSEELLSDERASEDRRVHFLLQSEELSDERALEDRIVFFYHNLKSCCLTREL